jgi:hypothetical protein
VRLAFQFIIVIISVPFLIKIHDTNEEEKNGGIEYSNEVDFE